MKKLTLTVLDKKTYPDFLEKYCYEESEFASICDQFEIGQVFVTEHPANRPEDFCAWAWDNIRLDVERVYDGVTLPWVKVPNTNVACCADGFRPVFFEIHLSEEM